VNVKKLLEQYPGKDYSPKWDIPHNPDYVYEPPTEEEMEQVSLSNPFRGMKHTEETLQQMRKPRKNTENMKGPKSPEHVANMVKAMTGRKWEEGRRKSLTETCPHCGVTTITVNIKRWHKKCRGEE
jgi:hypothetical protein